MFFSSIKDDENWHIRCKGEQKDSFISLSNLYMNSFLLNGRYSLAESLHALYEEV